MDQTEAAAVSVQLSDFGLEHARKRRARVRSEPLAAMLSKVAVAGKARLLAEAGGYRG